MNVQYIYTPKVNVVIVLIQDSMKDKYVIIDLRNMDYMKDKEGKICVYDTIDEAGDVCGIYEFEDAWICKLIYNHKETI